jgi:hypothetical protein
LRPEFPGTPGSLIHWVFSRILKLFDSELNKPLAPLCAKEETHAVGILADASGQADSSGNSLSHESYQTETCSVTARLGKLEKVSLRSVCRNNTQLDTQKQWEKSQPPG